MRLGIYFISNAFKKYKNTLNYSTICQIRNISISVFHLDFNVINQLKVLLKFDMEKNNMLNVLHLLKCSPLL